MHHYRKILRMKTNDFVRLYDIVKADALRWSSKSALWQLKGPTGGLVEQPVDGHGKIKQKNARSTCIQ